jgi:hypothetical protein
LLRIEIVVVTAIPVVVAEEGDGPETDPLVGPTVGWPDPVGIGPMVTPGPWAAPPADPYKMTGAGVVELAWQQAL